MAAGKLALFTICSNNYMPMVRAWVDSARRHHPEARLHLCLADRAVDEAGFYPDSVTLVEAHRLPIPDFEEFAFRYDMMEFNTALKPFMFRHLLAQGFDSVLYFDPDIEIFAPLEPILAPIGRGASLVLTPHLTRPAEGDAFPDDLGIMRAGVYNLGFLGVGAGPEADEILRWWSRRLRYDCINAQDRGLFVDQKFLDLAPGFGDHVVVLRDTSCNVAYWNLSQRRLERTSDGGWSVDGRALTFFHFSGFSPLDRSTLSKYTLGFRDDAIEPPLAALIARYAASLLHHGHGTAPAPAYAYGHFASGALIPDRVRRMFRERHAGWFGEDPFDSYEAFIDLPITHQVHGDARAAVTHLMEDVRQREPDLLSRFSPATRQGVDDYTRWFVQHGHRLIEERRLLAPMIARFGAADDADAGAAGGRLPRVTLIGYLRLALGVGEAGRQLLRSLCQAGIDARGLPIALNSASNPVETGLDSLFVTSADTEIELYSVNADQLGQVIDHLGERVSSSAHRIMMPFWELEEFPAAWHEAFSRVEEIWAPTRFIQAALVRATDKPVHHMPLLLDFDTDGIVADRAKFGLPDKRFLFFFAFDYFSFVERKNPHGSVEAFRRAFAGRDDVALVIKTQNFAAHCAASGDDADARALHDLIEGDPRCILIDATLSRADTLSLIASCDAVVSLHRSEGLGLLVAEAMALGRPVIATDYSATNDLLTPATGWPVDFRLVPVKAGQYPFHEGQIWAEPDPSHAAWQMRRVVADAEDREARVRAARELLAKIHSPAACADRIRSRLAAIAASRLPMVGEARR